MSDRYYRLFSLAENLHTEGSPVVISAGALLRDSVTGKVLAQLKFRNISRKTIIAVKVRILALDSAKSLLKGVDSFSYLDLSVCPGGEFGQNVPVVLPDTATRSFAVEILSAVAGDGTVFEITGQVAAPASQAVMNVILEQNIARATADRRQQEIRLAAAADENKVFKRNLILCCIPLGLFILAFVLHAYQYTMLQAFPMQRYLDRYGRENLGGLLVPALCLLATFLGRKNRKVFAAVGVIAIVLLVLQGFVGSLNTAPIMLNVTKMLMKLPKGATRFLKVISDWLPGDGWLNTLIMLFRGVKVHFFSCSGVCYLLSTASAAVIMFLGLKKKR